MSDSRVPERKRAAIEQAREGARLLRAGDYQGAISACKEAIRLDPQIHDAQLVLAEACRHSERSSPLRFFYSPSHFIWEILVFILRNVYYENRYDWYGGIKKPPRPPSGEHLDQHREAPMTAPMSLDDRETPVAPPSLGEGANNEERIGAECRALRSLGVDARVLERGPLSLESTGAWDSAGTWRGPIGWIEIAESPIRWLTLAYNWDWSQEIETFCFVPDPRIESGFPNIVIESTPVMSFPLFGRVAGVRWRTCGLYNNIAKDFTRRVTKSLSHSTAVTQRILSVHPVSPHVETFPDHGCWTISELDMGKTTAWTLPLWDCYQAIAEALLEMPMHADE